MTHAALAQQSRGAADPQNKYIIYSQKQKMFPASMDDLLKSKNLFSVSFGFFFFYFQLRPSDRQLWSSSARPTSAARGAPTATLPPTALGRFPASLPTACTTSTTSSVRSATPTSSPPPTERWGTVKRNLKKKYVSTAVEKKNFSDTLKNVPISPNYCRLYFIYFCLLFIVIKKKQDNSILAVVLLLFSRFSDCTKIQHNALFSASPIH